MKNNINELLSEAVAKILEAEKIAMHSLKSANQMYILRAINTSRWQLQECIKENERECVIENLDTFPCICGHPKIGHDWFGSSNCDECDCQEYKPFDQEKFDLLLQESKK